MIIHTPYFIGEGQWLVHNDCFHNADETAKRLGVSRKTFHEVIKKDILKDDDIRMFAKKIGAKNPDIGMDELGNIVLKNPDTGKTISTNIPISSFIDQ